MEIFCKMLMELEKETGLNEEEYCKKLGMPRSTYRTWKYGQVPESLNYLSKIARFHGVTLDHLVWGNDDEYRSMRKVLLAMRDFLKYQRGKITDEKSSYNVNLSQKKGG